MEAANRGAKEAGGFSVGFNIELPHEQEANALSRPRRSRFRHFYARKVMLVKAAEGFILFPGGFGTLDELFESLTLIQTDKVREFPVSLIGADFWSGLLTWIAEQPLATREDLAGGPEPAARHRRRRRAAVRVVDREPGHRLADAHERLAPASRSPSRGAS